MMPTKAGRGSMGVRDLGLWLIGLGRSMRGGGMRCLETKKSNDSSDSLIECSSFWGESGRGESTYMRQ